MTDLDRLEQTLFIYAEYRLGRSDAMTPDEAGALSERIADDSTLRERAEAIEARLRRMRAAPAPRAPEGLAARCLDAARRPAPVMRPVRRWAAAFALIAAVFALGMMVEHQRVQTGADVFAQLIADQSGEMQRLEDNLAKKYGAELTAANPWSGPIGALKQTNASLAAAFEKHQTDPVVARGLTIAVMQNLALLKSLNQYVESSGSIPEFDYALFDANESPAI
ncbi:MAG: hypothetical protein GC154_08180 [bacterium]|nr:hypothetical protein [bacterium]